jgi:hypothetical protein
MHNIAHICRRCQHHEIACRRSGNRRADPHRFTGWAPHNRDSSRRRRRRRRSCHNTERHARTRRSKQRAEGCAHLRRDPLARRRRGCRGAHRHVRPAALHGLIRQMRLSCSHTPNRRQTPPVNRAVDRRLSNCVIYQQRLPIWPRTVTELLLSPHSLFSLSACCHASSLSTAAPCLLSIPICPRPLPHILTHPPLHPCARALSLSRRRDRGIDLRRPLPRKGSPPSREPLCT